ncbi:MAG: SpoIIE family protein phosphatase [Acidobacteriota bacterium]
MKPSESPTLVLPAPEAVAATAAPARGNLSSLLIHDSPSEERTLPLNRDRIRMGRKGDNDLQFLEKHVSKFHAEILRNRDHFLVRDADSKAGLFVNGKRVRECRLADGDVIQLGLAPYPNLVFQDGTATHSSTTQLLSILQETPGEQGIEKLARFLEFNQILGGKFTLEEILENVVDMAVELTGAERGFLLRKSAGDGLDCLVARNNEPAPIPSSEVRISETIVRNVLETGKAEVHSDVQEEFSLLEQESVVALNLRSAAGLPLWRFDLPQGEGFRAEPSNEVFGVLYLDSQEKGNPFSRIDQGILETLARNASSVIENSRLLRETEKKRRMEEEMRKAQEVQEALMSQPLWDEPHFQVSGSCTPCLQLGGDYLGQFRMPDGRCCLVIADVSGKGMPAAITAAALQGMMAVETTMKQSLATLVERINKALCGLTMDGQFATLFCCTLDKTGELRYVNAGHTHPVLLDRSGEVINLKTGDMALGFLEDNRYREGSLRLQPGDLLTLYTDGVTEAVNGDGDLFEEPRLERLLNRCRDQGPEQIRQSLLQEMESFCGEVSARDDVTVMVMKYRGESPHADSSGI